MASGNGSADRMIALMPKLRRSSFSLASTVMR